MSLNFPFHAFFYYSINFVALANYHESQDKLPETLRPCGIWNYDIRVCFKAFGAYEKGLHNKWSRLVILTRSNANTCQRNVSSFPRFDNFDRQKQSFIKLSWKIFVASTEDLNIFFKMLHSRMLLSSVFFLNRAMFDLTHSTTLSQTLDVHVP